MKSSTKLLYFIGPLSATVLLTSTTAVLADGDDHHHRSTKKVDQTTTQWLAEKNPIIWPYQSKTVMAAEETLGQPALFGQWSDVVSWPVVAVHANLLPNGKVLAWDATPDDFDDDPHTTENFTTRVTLWDPIDGTHVATNNNTNADLFCAGSAHLWDGRILFAGGDSGVDRLNGPLPNTSIYDYVTNTWRQTADMAAPRWYSSVAALANGEMLTLGGTYEPTPLAEVFQFNETWRPLDIVALPYASVDHQWLQAIPQGGVMSFGPQNTLFTVDTEDSGSLTAGPDRDQLIQRHYGSYAMYDIGKVLVAGGSDNVTPAPSYTSSVVIDTETMQSTDTGSMSIGRNQHDLTILADGTVLAIGGNFEGANLVSPNGGVYSPELWDPSTGQWRFMNDMQVSRQYHSIALLLPDGRVLSAGGGYCGDCTEIGYEEQNAEIFSPPYLFSEGDTLAIRPQINGGQSFIDYKSRYTFLSDQAAAIAKVHLIKLGATTHSQNQDQRLVPLEFHTQGNAVFVNAPDNRNIAPPGHYLLFFVNDKGVPSIGKMIKVGQPLIESGTMVSNSVRSGETETYLIESTAQDAALQVQLASVTPGTKLTVTGNASNGAVTATCSNSAVGQSVECRLSNQVATSWSLEVQAVSTTPYDLVATLSTVADPGAEQPVVPAQTPEPVPVPAIPGAPDFSVEPPDTKQTVPGAGAITISPLGLLMLLLGFFTTRLTRDHDRQAINKNG